MEARCRYLEGIYFEQTRVISEDDEVRISAIAYQQFMYGGLSIQPLSQV